jgi:hypothetical protein
MMIVLVQECVYVAIWVIMEAKNSSFVFLSV